MTNNRELLLHGAIRRNRGRGRIFYQALQDATVEELQSAQAALSGKLARYTFPFVKTRLEAIERELAEREEGL